MDITLDEFKNLSTMEQIKLVNSYSDGKKTLTKIEANFRFTNISKYINKNDAYWDGSLKKFILRNTNNLTEQEINFVKQNYERHIESKTLEIDKKNIITRSIRVDKKIMSAFICYCKTNNIKQTNAFNIALKDYMNK